MGKMKSLSRYPGVQIYESSQRKHAGRPDVCYYIRYRNARGTQIQEKIGWASEGITAAYAYQIRMERIRAVRLGDEAIPFQHRRQQMLTLDEFMREQYLPSQNDKASYQREEQLYRMWISHAIGNKLMNEISPLDIERVKKRMSDAGKAPRTIQYAVSVIRHAFNLAAAWGIFTGDNPVKKVSLPQRDNKRIRFLSVEEANILLDACKQRSQKLYEICLLSLHTGMRAGEIFSLKWGDIDVERGLIYIKDPKNRHNRVAYMTVTVREIFSQKQPGDPDALVFPARKGSRIRAISDTFDRVITELGFNDGITDRRDKVVFHTLRHTFASWLALNGTPLLTIKELLGHKSISMTERYAHLLPDAKQQAIRECFGRHNQTKPDQVSQTENDMC